MIVGNGVLPANFAADDHSSYKGVGINVVQDGRQDYDGIAYQLQGDTISPIELDPVPLTGKGIPGS